MPAARGADALRLAGAGSRGLRRPDACEVAEAVRGAQPSLLARLQRHSSVMEQSTLQGLPSPLFGFGIFWLRFVTGWDDTLLEWARLAQASPEKALTWTSSAGLQRAMPAWQAVGTQHRLLLQALGGELPESVPLAALSSDYVAKAQASHTEYLLVHHALQNASTWRQRNRLSTRDGRLHARWKLEDWAAACVRIAEKHQARKA